MNNAGKNPGESSGRKTWNILYPFLIYFVAHDLAQVALAFLMNLSMLRFGEEYAAFMNARAATVNGILNGLSLLIGMAFVWPMARRELAAAEAYGGGSLRRELQKRKREGGNTVFLKYTLLLTFSVTLALGANILLSLTGLTGRSAAYGRIAASQYGVAFWAGLVVYGLLSPLAEEIVFRGVIFNRMKRGFPTGLSVVVCALLFGVYHGNLVQGVYGFILGLAITAMYECYHSFAAPVLFHAAANVSVFVLGYRQEAFVRMLTPVYCALFLGASVLCLLLILRLRRRELEGDGTIRKQ